MPLLWIIGAVGFWAVAYKAGQNKTKIDRQTELPPLVNGASPFGAASGARGFAALHNAAFEVHNEGEVGLCTFDQAIEIGRACPGAKFRRIG